MALADEKSILMQKHCANFRVCTRPKGFTDDIFGRSGVADASAASESKLLLSKLGGTDGYQHRPKSLPDTVIGTQMGPRCVASFRPTCCRTSGG